MVVVYHVADKPITDQLDTSLYNIPPRTPYEIENDFHAGKLLEYFGGNFGLVRVNTRREHDGIKYDLETALTEATNALARGEIAQINRYITVQLEDRLSRNYPPLPPNRAILALIKKHGVDLGAYGIRPVGMIDEATGKVTGAINAPVPMTPATDMVSRADFDALQTKLDQLMATLGVDMNKPPADPGKKSGKQ